MIAVLTINKQAKHSGIYFCKAQVTPNVLVNYMSHAHINRML